MSQPTRPFLGESAETRISARRQILLETAFQMAAESGWKGLSIHQLCQEAGLNKRYFYESFADLDELGAALVDDLAERLIATGQAAVQSGLQQGFDTMALARHALRQSIGWLVEDPRRARMLFSMAGDNPRALQHRQDVIRKLAQTLSVFSIEYHQADEPHVIVKVGSALLIGGTIEIVVGWLDGQLEVSLDELVEDVASFWVAVGNSAIELTKRRLEKKAVGKRPKKKTKTDLD
ncbi:MAG TPA: TetR/AcrR family transcriptional regulator [Candidatus Kapabacteria bacterium]|nr:TetR/AcrR family transcriptional regulator [Candidatus Kapabacteria bacterium]